MSYHIVNGTKQRFFPAFRFRGSQEVIWPLDIPPGGQAPLPASWNAAQITEFLDYLARYDIRPLSKVSEVRPTDSVYVVEGKRAHPDAIAEVIEERGRALDERNVRMMDDTAVVVDSEATKFQIKGTTVEIATDFDPMDERAQKRAIGRRITPKRTSRAA